MAEAVHESALREGAVAPEAVPVAFVSSHARQGGSEKYLEWLVESLDDSWVRVVVSLEEGPLTAKTRELGRPTEVIPTGPSLLNVLRASWQLRRVLSRTRPSLVHANGVKAALVAAIATLLTDVPFVWLKCDFSMDGLIARVIAVRSREIIGVSRAVTRTFGPRTQRKVRVVYTGIPETETDRDAGRRLVLDFFEGWEPRHVALLVGRMESEKGHRELLEAAPAVVERLPDTGFVFLGGEDFTTEYATGLRQRVAELGLERHVVFLPYRSDPRTIMSGCDVLVHPSVPVGGANTEGFPLVALESLLVGTPVVGYANGGLPELVGECGRLVPRGERAALAQALIALLQNDELRRELGASGEERVRTNFLLPRHVEAMKQRYRVAAGLLTWNGA